MPEGILLATINAKWIHPSLALRLLKANLGPLEDRCQITEFALRQPMREKINPILEARPKVLGLSVSIWNHADTLDLLKNLHKEWDKNFGIQKPVVVLGGPEVSYLHAEAEIFTYCDYCIRGEGEVFFKTLCDAIFNDKMVSSLKKESGIFFNGTFFDSGNVNLSEIKTAYHLYSNEDLQKKLTYVEASRGCPYSCEFCMGSSNAAQKKAREFPLEEFISEMELLIERGGKTFKFLDRSFNSNIKRAQKIMEFFLEKIKEHSITVHFEMTPLQFPPELLETITRFPPGSLRLEIGIQTLNIAVAERIGRQTNPEKELETLRFLSDKTNAIIHADLIAGLPGEDIVSFGKGFDSLWSALRGNTEKTKNHRTEIQLGILKLLPGAAIARHTDSYGMNYNPSPPYEVIKTAAMPEFELNRIKNFARFWESTVNRGLWDPGPSPVFDRFLIKSDSLAKRFGRNWGIPKDELMEAMRE